MKKQEMKTALKNNKIICTSAKKFLGSRISWCIDEPFEAENYKVNIIPQGTSGEMFVAFIQNDDVPGKRYNTEFTEDIEPDNISDFKKELIENCEIFELKLF